MNWIRGLRLVGGRVAHSSGVYYPGWSEVLLSDGSKRLFGENADFRKAFPEVMWRVYELEDRLRMYERQPPPPEGVTRYLDARGAYSIPERLGAWWFSADFKRWARMVRWHGDAVDTSTYPEPVEADRRQREIVRRLRAELAKLMKTNA